MTVICQQSAGQLLLRLNMTLVLKPEAVIHPEIISQAHELELHLGILQASSGQALIAHASLDDSKGSFSLNASLLLQLLAEI